MKIHRMLPWLAVLSLALLAVPVARADTAWPNRPVRILVGFLPGGISDVLARHAAQHLAERLGSAVVVENRSGGTGLLAAEACARAVPDGHTLCILAAPVLSLAPLMRPARLGFDPDASFAPVLLFGTEPTVLVVGAATPVRTPAELVEWVAARGPTAFATTGAGTASHLALETLGRRMRLPVEHVPYRGSVAAVSALLGGQVPAAMLVAGSIMPQLREGRLRAVAVSGSERSPVLPEVPTLRETLLPELGFENYQALFAPAGTPAPVLARIGTLLAGFLQEAAMRQRLREIGFEVRVLQGEAFAAWLLAGQPGWRALVQGAGVTGIDD
jgi:tripartite-type tricarboxylate transporter receptor subunit TctC